jgi:hypothetical protein
MGRFNLKKKLPFLSGLVPFLSVEKRIDAQTKLKKNI